MLWVNPSRRGPRSQHRDCSDPVRVPVPPGSKACRALSRGATWQPQQSCGTCAPRTREPSSSLLQVTPLPKALLHDLWPHPLPKSWWERPCATLPRSTHYWDRSNRKARAKQTAWRIQSFSTLFWLNHKLPGAHVLSRIEGDRIQALQLLRF